MGPGRDSVVKKVVNVQLKQEQPKQLRSRVGDKMSYANGRNLSLIEENI